MKIKKKKYLFLISLDAVGDTDVDYMAGAPFLGRLMRESALVRRVDSVFVSNTYPAHTSIITGCLPGRHGVVDNIVGSSGFGGEKPLWRWHRGHIRTTTLFDEAKARGLSTCSIFWPVTASADITYNMPEIFDPHKPHAQLNQSFANGSVAYQTEMLVKFFGRLYPFKQRGVDNFNTAAAVETIKKYRPNLMLLHFFDMDEVKHRHGNDPAHIKYTLLRIDERLRRIYEAVRDCGILDESAFIFTGDHAQQDVHTLINLNRGLGAYYGRAFFHNSGGSAFLRVLSRDEETMRAAEAVCAQNLAAGVMRPLSHEEMTSSGMKGRYSRGFEAAEGYYFGQKEHGGAHGYTTGGDRTYTTFYMLHQGGNGQPGSVGSGGCITDIAPLAARILGIPPWETDGKLNGLFT